MKQLLLVLSLGSLLACQAKPADNESKEGDFSIDMEELDSTKFDTITLGAGCFWCVEAVFQDLKGVKSAVSGYSGGRISNPTYREVCSGLTGHAEVIQLDFDTSIITVDEVLEVFWQTHDPTTLNRQGADAGTQYRSAVFYHNEYQRERAEYFKKRLNEEQAFGSPIVTEITSFGTFYPADDYHQEYYNNNGSEPYCRMVIKPKVDKVKKIFGDKLKSSAQ